MALLIRQNLRSQSGVRSENMFLNDILEHKSFRQMHPLINKRISLNSAIL